MDTNLLPKKRGRPQKKADPNDVRHVEPATSITRRTSATSTRKATVAKPKTTKNKTSRASKSDGILPKSQPEGVEEVAASEVKSNTLDKKRSTVSSTSGSRRTAAAKAKEVQDAPSRRESKILQELAAKDISISEKTAASETLETAPGPTQINHLLATKSIPKPQSPSTKFSPSAQAKAHSANINAPPSLKQMNAYAVNSLSQRAHTTRPLPTLGQAQGNIGPKYKSVARRITTLMVAIPIVGVTSWVLYERRE
jgi:hypothetical protein